VARTPDTVSPLARISLNVIVFNEKARLQECLSDARDHVDEIVVVDQMSTDGTGEIAERLADVYVRDVHHGHAEPSRELAASRSSGDWILILDADETMSDRLKSELRGMTERDVDGYWIQKVNSVGGTVRNKIQHFRLVRKNRVRFDPRPHGGATAVSDNVERLEWTGIVHEKSVAEQVIDDARYERMALEDDAPTSQKRNWLSHNRVLREERQRSPRQDLEQLLPAGVTRILLLGDVTVEPAGCVVERVDHADLSQIALTGTALPFTDGAFDAAIVALAGDDLPGTMPIVAGLVRPGGVIVGTVPAARNRRRIEEFVAGVLSNGAAPDTRPVRGSTRAELASELAGAGLDVRWMRVLRDGHLDPVALRPDAAGSVVESDDFLLRSVSAEVAEELTAQEIVFAAAGKRETDAPLCSIIVASVAGEDPQRFADALREAASGQEYELVLVRSQPSGSPVQGATSVLIGEQAGLVARWNAGARAAWGELLVFVSADAIPLPGWLDALVEVHQSRPDAGAVGSKVIGLDGTIEHAGLVIGPERTPYRLYQGEAPLEPYVSRPRIMPAVAAEGMVTARARFVEVGGFDETLGEDLADADLCLRLRGRGLPILYAPNAVLRSRGRSAAGTREDFRRSAREFAARWSPTTFRSDELVCWADRREINPEVNRSWQLPRPSGPGAGGLPAVAWTSHFNEHGGYTEEAIAAVEALEDAGLHIVANTVIWDRRAAPRPARKAERLAALLDRDLPDEFVHVAHIGANRFKRHPAALLSVGRTMFETDGLPREWVDRCNLMDEVWVPSEHNLRTFANAGVVASKLHKVPETFDPALFDPQVAPLEVEGLGGFVFLSVFSWIERKAWDVLLRAWFEEFDAGDDVTLLLKTDPALAGPSTDCRREVDRFVRRRLKRDPNMGARIVVLDEQLEVTDVPRLYRSADAFVLASRGEGWGRPYMEAMAMGLPTIATGWSGHLDFMNHENSYLVDYELVPALHDDWRRGQLWAEPSVSDLRRVLRSVYEERSTAAAIGKRARADVLVSCRPELVAEAVRERLQALADRLPVAVDANRSSRAGTDGSAPRARRVKAPRHITACVVVRDDAAPLTQCLSSLEAVADETIVVHGGSSQDMAAVRNDALDRAIGEWVLMVDATHTLDPASADRVRELVRKNRFVGYAARELHQFGLDGAVSAVERRFPALFPLHPDLRYVGRVEEQLLPRRAGLKFQLQRSELVLHQHDFHEDRHDPAARARRDLPLLEQSAREAPAEPFHNYNLGVALHHLGLQREAEAALCQAIAAAPADTIWGPPAYTVLSRAVAKQGRTAEAVTLCEAATKLAPKWPQGWCMLGAALADDRRLKPALRAYARAVRCAEGMWLASDVPDDIAWQVRAAMAKIHLKRKEYDQAAGCLGRAIALSPGSAELHVLIARAYDGLHRQTDAGRHLEHATVMPHGGPGTFAAFGDFFTKKAEDALLRGLVENGENRLLLERIEQLRTARAMREP
jgi:glycosyltransferase involved in cell wall biosynthesis/tetratricopeptide (TPR) repeat protein